MAAEGVAVSADCALLQPLGDGSQTRAFCYVDDLIEGLCRLMASDEDVLGPVNLGNPQEIQVRELAERVIRLTGSRSQIVFRPLPQDDPLQRCPDIGMAQRILNWQPRTQLDEGLMQTIAYFGRLLGGREGAGAIRIAA